jgi:hypothetical protein
MWPKENLMAIWIRFDSGTRQGQPGPDMPHIVGPVESLSLFNGRLYATDADGVERPIAAQLDNLTPGVSGTHAPLRSGGKFYVALEIEVADTNPWPECPVVAP